MAEGIFITAAGKRIGACLAEWFGARGFYVYLHYNSGEDAARKTLDSIHKAGGDGVLVQGDLSDYDTVEGLLDQALNPDHPIRHLINNAALFVPDSIFDFTADSLAQHQQINLRAPLQLSRALHRLIGADENGTVTHIIDSKVKALNPDYHSYTLSKYALYGATEMMAQALSPKLRVNGIAPGLTLISSSQTAENFALAGKLNFTGLPVDVQDIARAAEFLIRASSVTGVVIPVDGGQKMVNLTGDIVSVTADILAMSHNRSPKG